MQSRIGLGLKCSHTCVGEWASTQVWSILSLQLGSFHQVQSGHGHGVSPQEHKGTWSWINQTWEYRRASGNVCVDVIDWWNSVICSNPSISHSWYLAESLGLEICSLCSFKFISLVSLNVNECQTCHFYSSCWEISCPFLICFSQRSWWTLRQRLLIWNGPSSQPPNPRYVIPAFTMLSVLLTRTVWWLGIFGFQLFLCYFGYKGVPYMAGNWQNKGRPEWVWDSKYIGSRCFDISHQPWSWAHWLHTSFEHCSQKTTYLQLDQLTGGC